MSPSRQSTALSLTIKLEKTRENTPKKTQKANHKTNWSRVRKTFKNAQKNQN